MTLYVCVWKMQNFSLWLNRTDTHIHTPEVSKLEQIFKSSLLLHLPHICILKCAWKMQKKSRSYLAALCLILILLLLNGVKYVSKMCDEWGKVRSCNATCHEWASASLTSSGGIEIKRERERRKKNFSQIPLIHWCQCDSTHSPLLMYPRTQMKIHLKSEREGNRQTFLPTNHLIFSLKWTSLFFRFLVDRWSWTFNWRNQTATKEDRSRKSWNIFFALLPHVKGQPWT